MSDNKPQYISYNVMKQGIEAVRAAAVNGAEVGPFSFSDALTLRSYEIAQFVVTHGAKPQEGHLYRAIVDGQQDMVQLIVDSGVKVTGCAKTVAMTTAQVEILEYLSEVFAAQHLSGDRAEQTLLGNDNNTACECYHVGA
jgi:hypothetical protein